MIKTAIAPYWNQYGNTGQPVYHYTGAYQNYQQLSNSYSPQCTNHRNWYQQSWNYTGGQVTGGWNAPAGSTGTGLLFSFPKQIYIIPIPFFFTKSVQVLLCST